MAAPATPTFILNWTNIWYKKLDRAHNASILASATLSDMRFETTGGDSVAQPFTLNGHRGDSGNFQAAQFVGSQAEFRNSAKYRWQVPYSEYHGSIQIAHRDIALSKTDRDAAVRARQHEVDMAFKQRASNMMRLWFAQIGSQIGVATLAAGVLTFADRHLAAKLFQGDVVSLASNDGDTAGQVVTGNPGFVTRSESEVAAANTGRISISAASATGAVGNPVGVVDGTYRVFRFGEYNSSNTNANIIPIQAYLPATPSSTELFNVQRRNDSRLSGLRVPDAVLAGRSIGSKIKNWIAQASDIAGIDGSEIDTVTLNPIDWQLAEEEFTSTVTRSPVEVGEDGFSRMYINTANGRTKLVNEKHCPQGTAFFFASKQLCFHSPTGNIAQWLDEEGSIIRRKESEPVYEMNPVSYLATIMESPYAHGRMSTTI
jgi:hypothetical protein